MYHPSAHLIATPPLIRHSVAPITRISENKEREDICMEKTDTPSQDDEALPASGSKERLLAERRLVRKLDMQLIPIIFIFIMNYIDVSC